MRYKSRKFICQAAHPPVALYSAPAGTTLATTMHSFATISPLGNIHSLIVDQRNAVETFPSCCCLEKLTRC